MPDWWTAVNKAARDRVDAFHVGDLRRFVLLEGELRARQEERVVELRARLAQLREIGDHRAVRLDDLACPAAGAEASLTLGRSERDGEVGADAGERIEGGLLGVVQPAGERRDHDHKRDAESQPGDRHDRPPATPCELAAGIPHEEHGGSLLTPPESFLGARWEIAESCVPGLCRRG